MEALGEPAHTRHAIREPEDVGAARRELRRLALAAGVDEVLIARAELVLTELGTNLLRHADPGGYLLFCARPGAGSVELLSVDSGPGIADVKRALAAPTPEDYERRLREERRRTETPFNQLGHAERRSFEERRRSLGAGLSSAQRLATAFEVFTRVGSGTIVLARLEPPRVRPPAVLMVAGISVPVDPAGCGDSWAVVSDAGGATLLVVDGLGHGPQAMKAAEAACAVFRSGYDGTPEDYVRRANGALRGTRGAAAGWCRVDTVRNALRFSGIGNIEGRVFRRESSNGLASRPGTLGISLSAPASRPIEVPWEPGATLVLYSDGIRSLYDPQRCHETAGYDPAILAALLHRDEIRRRDDATVVVVRDTRAVAA